MTQWYVVHKQARAEEKAVWHCENQGLHCFIPRIRALRRHARKVTPAFSPLFRRYLFVRCELDIARWRAINGTRGIARLLTNGKFPLPVPLAWLNHSSLTAISSAPSRLIAMSVFVRGIKVRITSGAFSGQTAKVKEIFAEKRNRVHVLLTLLGAAAELQLPSFGVEAA
jgi:transcriptional antiterminator RfaH